MYHFVVKFSKFSSPQAARGINPLTKILRTFLTLPRDALIAALQTIRYEMLFYRAKADMSQLNLLHGTNNQKVQKTGKIKK